MRGDLDKNYDYDIDKCLDKNDGHNIAKYATLTNSLMLSMPMLINTWTIQLTKPLTNLLFIFEEEQKFFCTY